VSRGTQEPLKEDCIFGYRAVTCSGRPFQTVHLTLSYPCSTTPATRRFPYSENQPAGGVIVVLQPQALLANRLVWALPISLATTFGISIDFSSSGY
jgi:hypothetical protein